ncbi:MAG TPA: hypothetical protein VFI12_10130, partial [Thermomicrobiales bacterium]|nr:hypothetical protein [Thermomicrobiales bacterium]
LIVRRLLEGKRVMHTAQDRKLPQEVFTVVAEFMWEHHAKLFPQRNGRATKPRYANGQEEVILRNGGVYSIVAPTRGGARGPSRDLVIVDELREMDTWDFIAAAKPTLTASKDPQMIYLSNAGADLSVVLNKLRERRDADPSLAYLEWSAPPDLRPDDVEGWAAANPGMGHETGEMGSIYETLVDDYRTAALENTLAIFETEHLCRWVDTMREPFVEPGAWAANEANQPTDPHRPYMAISMDPGGKRAAAAIAWPRSDDKMGFRLLFDVTGNPINVDKLGPDMAAMAQELHVPLVGFDPLTDAVLAKAFRKTEKLTGAVFANACADFVQRVEGQKIAWDHAAAVGEDLQWTARKLHDDSGSFQAVRADDNRPIPAALAAIRAVGLAARPSPRSVYEDRGVLALG